MKHVLLWLIFVVHVTLGRKHRQFVHRTPHGHTATPPNILLILTDDLGYGDTSVQPFVGLGIQTPNLERMAAKGTKLTNYHTAAATCTPTRASILTGMYPWRMGIKSVFEYGNPGKVNNRNDWLTPVPTIPMVLREANYSVTHSGKWHLGGMRNDDYDMRLLPVKPKGEPGARRCPHPGPNQQGFKNYVSVLDGPGSPRQNRLQLRNKLYSEGCTALLHNDVDIGGGQNANATEYLTYCEAEHAIQAMNRSVARGKPFFINLWFHAPHSPLEEIPGWHERLFGQDNASRPLDNNGMYRTMVADMDHQVGRLLRNIAALGIEQSTLVVFTSDNGPEPFAGNRAGLKGAKRFLYEGGIRVPAIVQWGGTVPAGQASDAFVVSTDLFPTFLDAAGVLAPAHLRLDGLSILPLLVPDYYKEHSAHAVAPRKESTSTEKHVIDTVKDDATLYHDTMRDRVTLWHNDYEGLRRSAAWLYDYKVILDEKEELIEMYDMRNDLFEATNLVTEQWSPSPVPASIAATGTAPGIIADGRAKISLARVLNERKSTEVHRWVARRMTAVLQAYVDQGNNAHALQKSANPGWAYPATQRSNLRADHIRGWSPMSLHLERERLMNGTCGDTPCGCEVKTVGDVGALPFEKTPVQYTYLHPGKLLNGAQLLELQV
jgi:arylsulfatase A-like enzyme